MKVLDQMYIYPVPSLVARTAVLHNREGVNPDKHGWEEHGTQNSNKRTNPRGPLNHIRSSKEKYFVAQSSCHRRKETFWTHSGPDPVKNPPQRGQHEKGAPTRQDTTLLWTPATKANDRLESASTRKRRSPHLSKGGR